MAHFNFVISQNAKWGHAGFYTDCHRMTVPENILLQKSTGYTLKKTQDRPYAYCLFTYLHNTRGVNMTERGYCLGDVAETAVDYSSLCNARYDVAV